ncbi:MAG: STAS domain-containing protein [Candidatus Aminicenantaceae bacterium]
MNVNIRKAGDISIFDIEGEIRRSEFMDSSLHDMVKDLLEEGNRKILLNLKNVDFIDSYGVGEILAGYISINNAGGQLKLAHISQKLSLVFQVTMLSKVFDIHDTEKDALDGFS